MGKKWDHDVPSEDLWREVLRVLKPGGHLLSFFGTRTYHAGVTRIEAAGFEVRDMLSWLYGSGFPKSLDVSKAIDKAAGAEREVVGLGNVGPNMRGGNYKADDRAVEQFSITAPATEAAKRWQGYGTALKPANEPIVLARKPLEKGLTVAQNVLKWGTGALNIDGTRIAHNEECRMMAPSQANIDNPSEKCKQAGRREAVLELKPNGRWPANVLFDEEAAAVLDEQSGTLSKQGSRKLKDCPSEMFAGGSKDSTFYGDSGGASRFFYVAKASKRERNAGLEGMPEREATDFKGKRLECVNCGKRTMIGSTFACGCESPDPQWLEETKQHRAGNTNHHPTVKPVKLMEYLITLVCPPGAIVLDPFMGSGTTGVAAKRLGREFIGIEREAEYLEIASKRIGP